MSGIGAEIPAFLSALRALPLWIILGLALAGYAVLFAPPFADVELAVFRRTWGVWVWVEAVFFTVLFVVGICDWAISAFSAHRRDQAARHILRLIPLSRQSWWHLAKQQDDSFVSQIDFECQITNTTDRAVQLVKVRLLRPRSKQLNAFVLLPMDGSLYHRHDFPVRPHSTVTASIHLMVRGALATQGKPIRITVSVTDQFGEEYKLKHLTVVTLDPPATAPALLARLRTLGNSIALACRMKNKPMKSPSPPMPWTFEAGHSYLTNCDSILDEERRCYAVRGRTVGQLGSLNVGLQSEPNFGVTTVGNIPSLLWPKDRATQLSSPNLDRLLRIRASLAAQDGDNLERYLLCQLQISSRFADIAYFVFLALHRMQRTSDALRAARSCLAGDKVYGYSNMLGTLSALISHEYFVIKSDTYEEITAALSGSTEHDFRLKEKLNLARLERLDESVTA